MAGTVKIAFFVEERRYLYFEQVGPYFKADASFEKLNKILEKTGLANEAADVFCIWQDDPDVVPAELLRSRVCVFVPLDLPCPPELSADHLPPGKYAHMVYEGKYEEVREHWKFFYGVWLPHSGYEVRRNVPAFEVYPGRMSDLPESKQITELYICLT